MMTLETMRSAEKSRDAQLVAESLAGNREAFRQIVERYQNLIASVAYGATGNLSQSEDLAQETFVTAWNQLAELREPAKLCPWLCSLVRFRISKEFRRQQREPIHAAESLDKLVEATTPEPSPIERVITEEEKALLWRSLQQIPEIYREPLVLFYREQKSMEAVAHQLGLSEDAVRQRLSRGRKLLQEEVQSFVESALGRTVPGERFSASVLAALPAAGGSAVAVGAGVGGKSAVALKSGVLVAWLAFLAPFLGIAAGVLAQGLVIRERTTDPKLWRKQIIQVIVAWVIYLGLAMAGESAMHWLARHFQWNGQTRFITGVGYWWCFLLATITFQLVMTKRVQAVHQQREEAVGSFAASSKPMRPVTLAMVVAGSHLMIFSWLLSLTWRAGDPLATAVAAGAMVVLALLAFIGFRGKTVNAVARALAAHLSLAGGLILLLVNLRADVWVATSYGVSVAEAHHLQPLWSVPLLSLILVFWTVLAITLIQKR